MKIYIVIPVYNEEKFVAQMLTSLVTQTLVPDKIVVVDDSSSDNSAKIIQEFSDNYSFIKYHFKSSSSVHAPGAKVVEAFYSGLQILDEDYDLIGKFDADLILPPDYFEKMQKVFSSDERVGMASGILFIENRGKWEFENISKKDKVRGPVKLFRKKCFEDIGGLKRSIGWDTVDELLARYHGWKVTTDLTAQVKHLKPTGKAYTKASRYKQGEAFFRMRYGMLLSGIASAKLAWSKRSLSLFTYSMIGYFRAKKDKVYIVNPDEGKFIRKFRWRHMLSNFNLCGKSQPLEL